jgi:hypothetical protein
VPQKFNTDRINEHGEQLAKLDQRMNHVQKNLDRVEESLLELKKTHIEVQMVSAITTKTVERIEKRADETYKSRCDVIILLLSAGTRAVIVLAEKWIEINIFKNQGRGK